MVTHIVIFKMKDPSPEIIESTRARIAQIEGQIPQLRSLKVGANLVKGEYNYDLALVATCDTVEDLLVFEQHPIHLALLQDVMSRYSSFYVVDFES